MSLRIRLFLMLSCLVLLLVLAQGWWVRSLARGLGEEVDALALHVGSSVAEVFADPGPLHRALRSRQAACADGAADCSDVRVVSRMVHRIDERRIESVDDQTFTWHGTSLADGSATPLTGADRGGGGPPRQGGLSYSFRVQHICIEGDEDCLRRRPEIVVVPAAADAGFERHLVLNIAPGDASATDTAAAVDEIEVRRIGIPGDGVRARLDRFVRRSWLGAGTLLTLGLLGAALVAQRVSAPLRRLSEATARVGDGALGTQVGPERADREVGQAITAFNRMSERLASLDRAHRELAAREHLGEIGDIARGLAHTLRNPLNALGLSLEEIATRAGEGQETEPLVTGAQRQIRRIDASIRSFLALTSHGGGADSVTEPVEVAELARDVALEALQDASSRVRVEVEARGAGRIDAVAPELRAVLQALVVNAIEASPDGATVAVEVIEPRAGRARVTVADRGDGLPTAVRERLFLPHQTTKAHGSGMGLFLAHRIATMRYRGSLRLDDRQGGGTCAVLELGDRADGGRENDERRGA